MNHTPLPTAAQDYRIKRESLLAAMPELADDDDCLRDTLEGCTTIQDQLAALIRSALEDQAMADGLKVYREQLYTRWTKLTERATRKRAIALHYMADLGMPKISTPDMTISRRPVPPSVVIVDESLLPKELLRVRTEPDKTAIKAALANGPVAGAIMSNGSETISVKI
jgi:hypothetical protein